MEVYRERSGTNSAHSVAMPGRRRFSPDGGLRERAGGRTHGGARDLRSGHKRAEVLDRRFEGSGDFGVGERRGHPLPGPFVGEDPLPGLCDLLLVQCVGGRLV
jgi:hypothetical protein